MRKPNDPPPRWQAPVAYLLTTTTYGTWLHGDAHGSINRHGWSVRTRFLGPDPELEERKRKQMKQPPFKLGAQERGVVHHAILDYCDLKQWPLKAINVRTNHIHVVVNAVEDGARMLGAMKSRATRLLRENGLIGADRKVWTYRGGITFLVNEDEVAEAIRYVMDGQGPDLPMA